MSDTQPTGSEHWHRRIFEPNATLMAIVTTLVMSVGGLVEIVPMFSAVNLPENPDIHPYTPLEVAGRDLYAHEGCVACHSQMVRPMRSETLRYGAWTRSYEYEWDRPFLLGSRRIGPDLQREGGKYPDAWHWNHLNDPRSTSPGSRMPVYSWLLTNKLDPADTQASVKALKTLGTPYTDADVANVPQQMAEQGKAIAASLATAGIQAQGDEEAIALIAYLQRLGKDGKAILAASPSGGAAAPAGGGEP